jgi:DNA-binding transcriptional ArsR family regulator
LNISRFSKTIGAVPRRAAHADVFLAIADANRRRLLDLLASSEHSVGALVARTGISYSLTSQHLAVLHKAHLVKRRRQGRHQLYRVDARPLRRVHDWTAHYQALWTKRLERLRALVDATP